MLSGSETCLPPPLGGVLEMVLSKQPPKSEIFFKSLNVAYTKILKVAYARPPFLLITQKVAYADLFLPNTP